MDERDRVLEVNRRFYAAFLGRDLPVMETVWAWAHPVACIHPGWHPMTDREEILRSWREIFTTRRTLEIRIEREQVLQLTADTALVICQEEVSIGLTAACNGFVLEDGVWRLALHHATPLARIRSGDMARPHSGPPVLH